MNISIVDVAAAVLGACVPEVFFWHGAKTKLSNKKYDRLLHSSSYWGVTAAMLVMSAAGSWLWFYGEAQSPKNFLLAGAAFPMLVKKGMAALSGGGDPTLGPDESSALTDYLSIS